MRVVNNKIKRLKIPKDDVRKVKLAKYPRREELGGQMVKPLSGDSASTRYIGDDLTKLREAAASVHQIRISAQRELEQAKRIRLEAQKYQQETEIKARSEAQQLILRTRLATQKEIEEIIRQASDEVQKLLADIRVIRITAQEELAAQRKFTDAAKIYTLSMAIDKEKAEPEVKRKKQLTLKK